MIIEGFVSSFLIAETSSEQPVLYISGSPGTGKTALVNTVLQHLQIQIEQAGIKVLTINCMALESIDSVWDRLAEILADGASQAAKARKTKKDPIHAVESLLAQRQSKWSVQADHCYQLGSQIKQRHCAR